jgi:hypothetical protein
VIEKQLINREDNKSVENKICVEITEACKNVDPKNAPRHDDHIMIDGQPVKMGPDGTVRMPDGSEQQEDL